MNLHSYPLVYLSIVVIFVTGILGTSINDSYATADNKSKQTGVIDEYYLTISPITNDYRRSSDNDAAETDWPQVQKDPQHTGFSPETLGTNFQVIWTRPFQPEKINPQVQAIVYSGTVFVGTEMGNMYALDAQTGGELWEFSVGFPILNSVAVGDGKVFFGAMDGAVYAIDVAGGSLVWKSQLSWRQGFSTAPVIADNKIMLGGRNGIFYGLDLNSGVALWQYDVGAPILQTAAWSNGKAVFGTMDMYVYAINSNDGTLAWRSERLPGMAFKDYWPVIYQGSVYIRPMGNGGLGVVERVLAVDPSAQMAVLSDYEAHPENYSLTLIRLDENNGSVLPPVIHYNFQTMNGATAPPCIDRDGYLVMPAPFPETGSYQSGWGRLNPATRILVDLLNDGTDIGYGNPDESMNLTCTQNLIFTIHTEEGNAHDTAAFNLDTRQWYRIAAGHRNLQMSTNTQGGGGNPLSVSNGYLFHISYHELIVRTTTP